MLFNKIIGTFAGLALWISVGAQVPKPQSEDDFYRIITVPIPESVMLEVGGMETLPDGRLAVSTRRGELWSVVNPIMVDGHPPVFKKLAYGLHEPLGLLFEKGDFWTAQRGELTRIRDSDGDGAGDFFQTVARFTLSGNYHQYTYGPVKHPDGDMIITLNLDIVDGQSFSKWRGWLVRVDSNGTVTPWATGLRSPAGLGCIKGDIFITENQGDWIGSGYMTHLDRGDFAGHPAGLRWSSEPESPLKLLKDEIIRQATGGSLYELAQRVPEIKPPAVWFPYTLMGISTSDFKEDGTNGAFGPFDGQVFVGDFGHSKIMRVFLEKVKGIWQGACFPFREGFASGVFRLQWGTDGSLFVGQTNRGWRSTGKEPYALQRLVWTGKVPFEMKEIRSVSDGFEITFTKSADTMRLIRPEAWKLASFTYKYHAQYGSPVVEKQEIFPSGVRISPDGMQVSLVLDSASLRKGFIYSIIANGITSSDGTPLLHPEAYYTLNETGGAPTLEGKIFIPFVTHSADKTKILHVHQPATTLIAPQKETRGKRRTEQPDSWTNGPDQVVILGTQPGLKFDLAEVRVKAGSRVKWVFQNVDDMLHNCVITKPGTVDVVGEAAMGLGLDGMTLQYVPESGNVLFHTGLLQPESSEAIFFEAPPEPGIYHYTCTFPGHHMSMRGRLVITR